VRPDAAAEGSSGFKQSAGDERAGAVRLLIMTTRFDAVDVRRRAGWLPDDQDDLES
jgi:hypothetical protein